ncbi:hypothetical protein Esti_001417 [Eimeria stiedai]
MEEGPIAGLLALGRSASQNAYPPESRAALSQKQQLSLLPSSSVKPQSSQAHRSSSSSLAAASKEENKATATAAAAAAIPCCCSTVRVDEKSGGGPLNVPKAQGCWWRPPPPLLVRCLHTSTTAAQLRAAFASFGSLRCVLSSGGVEQRPDDSSGCAQPQTSRKRKTPRGLRAEGGVGLLWFTDHEATLRAVHAAPRVFRGLPCSLHPSGFFSSWGPLILLQGGPILTVGHAWRRCKECGSIAFEAAAAAPAPPPAADAADGAAAAAAAAGNVMIALRLGEEKQLRIAWAEGRHAVLLELPFRALISRVYVLAAAAETCSSSSSNSSSNRSVVPQQQQLLLCPEHAPRVTVAEVVEGGPSSQCAPDEAASAAAALLLREETAAVSPRWRCVRWACGAEAAAGLASPLLQRLSDCRDLLLPLSPPSCSQHPWEETHAGEGTQPRKGGPPLVSIGPHEGWVSELKVCGLLAQEGPSRLNLTKEPPGRKTHMMLVSQAVLQKDPSLLKSVSFPLASFPTNADCFSCAAAAAAAALACADADADKEDEAQNAADAEGAAGTPEESLNSTAKSQGEKQEEGTARWAFPPAAEDKADRHPFPPPPSGWLLWVELQEMLSNGLLSAPCLFEPCCTTGMESHQGGPLRGAPPPLPLLLADPRQEAYALRKALRRLALERLVEGEVISSVSPVARLQALLQEIEAACTPEDCSSSCMEGVCELMHIQLTPLRTLCRGVFQENTNRLLRLFPSLAVGGGFVKAGVAEETGARLYHSSMVLHRAVRASLIGRMVKGFEVGHLRFCLLGVSLAQLRKGAMWALNTAAPTSREVIFQFLGSFSFSDPGLFARQFGLPGVLLHRRETTCRPQHSLSRARNSPHCPPLAAAAAEVAAAVSVAAAEGCGFMSGELWRRLGALHPRLSRSSALQLRLGGFKGMLALHPAFPEDASSRGVHVLLHDSMKKLDSQLTTLEVNDNSRRLAAFLNHQVILIFDSLQVPLQAFEWLQQRMLDLLKGSARQRGELLALMHWTETDQDSRGPAQRIVSELLRSSAFSLKEPFLHGVAAAAETQCLLLLKNKARIFVEVSSRLRCMRTDAPFYPHMLSTDGKGSSRACWKRVKRHASDALLALLQIYMWLLLPKVHKGAYLFGVVDPTHTLLYDHGWRQTSASSRRCAGLPEVFVHLTRLAASRRTPCESEEQKQPGGPNSTSSSNSNNNSSSSKSSSSSSRDRFADVALPLPCGLGAPYDGYGAPLSEVLSGVVAVVKSPCMHPGDLQLCYAVGIEELPLKSPLRVPLERSPSQDDADPAAFAFRDLVVFPPPPVGWFEGCHGKRWPPLNPRHPGVLRKEPQVEYHFRDVPNMLSGGDLDGDRYWVLWEPAIVGPLFVRWKQGLAPSPVVAHEPKSAANTTLNTDAAAAAGVRSSWGSSSETDASDSERQSDTSEDDGAHAVAVAAAAARAGGEQAADLKAPTLPQTESSEGEATTTAAGLLLLSSTPQASSRDSEGFAVLQQAAAPAKGKEEEAAANKGLDEGPSSSLKQLAKFLLHVQNTWKLGTIANTHLRSAHAPAAYYAANGLEAKALDRAAVALADLAAAAVDAPKTGSKICLTRGLRCPLVPHFLERHKRRHFAFSASVSNPAAHRGLRLFASRSVLGCLYDRVCEAHLRLQSPAPLRLSPHKPREQLAATQPALNPQQVRVHLEGVQYKEEARLLFTGDTRVHCLRIDITLPGALVVGGPSLPGAPTQQTDSKPTLRALLFSVHPSCHTCPQRSRALQPHSVTLGLSVADPAAAQGQVAVGVSLEYVTPQSGAACRSPFVFSPPTRLPPESAWCEGDNSTVYVHCASATADLEALRGALNVQLVALLPPTVSAAVLLQQLSPLSPVPSSSSAPEAKQSVVYCGRLGGDRSSRSQLLALLFRRGTGIECSAAVDPAADGQQQQQQQRQQQQRQQQQPLAVLSATPQDVCWEDWRFMPWLTELKGDLFLLRCLAISSQTSPHADTCSNSSCGIKKQEADAELVDRLSKLLVGAVELQQRTALRLFPQLGPPLSTSTSRLVAAAYKGKSHAGKRSKLFVVLERSLTGLCLRLLLSELVAALPSSWPPAARMQRLSHSLGLRIYLPQLPGLLGPPCNPTPELARGAMDVLGAKALLKHHWHHRKHLLLHRQQVLLQQQQRTRELRATLKAWLLAATQGGRATPRDVICVGQSRATLVFSTGWEASCFLDYQAEGLNYLGIVVSRTPLPLEATLAPLWPPVHPVIKAAAAKQQETLEKAMQDTSPTASASTGPSLKKEVCVESAWGVCTLAFAFDSSSLPLSHLPSWHLRLRGIATHGALISFLQDFYKGALPLPMNRLEGPSLGAPLAAVGGGAPRELALDLDLLSWCPDKLLVFGWQVAKLKAAWDEEVTLLMLRFSAPDEASLLSGLFDKEAENPLSHMDSWAGKLQLAVMGLHAFFERRRFFGLSLNSEEKQIAAVTAYYFSYVPNDALKAFIANRDRVSSAALRLPTTKPTGHYLEQQQHPPHQQQQQQQQQQQHQQQQQQQQKQQQQQQQHLFSFPWMLYHRELKDIKALAASRAALQPP